MADIHAGGGGFGPSTPRGGLQPLSTALGAGVALALIGAVAWWGYGVSKRDVGQIPVIAAFDGPMKVRPESDGAPTLTNVDRAIGAVLGGQRAAETRLAPEPGAPTDEDLPFARLGEPAEDVAARRLGGLDAPAQRRVPGAEAGAGAGPAPLRPSDRLAAPLRQPGAEAAVPALPGAGEGAPPAAPSARAEAPAQAQAQPEAAPAPAPAPQQQAALAPAEPVDPENALPVAPRTAPVALARPGADARAEAAAAARAAAAAEAEARAAAAARTLSPGDDAVQLGAFNSPEVAEAEWKRLSAKHADVLGGAVHAVTTVKSGGRTLYRLRAGPADNRGAAQNICAAIKNRRDPCVAVKIQ
ncbi:SPOR domain-containing protein [Rhodovulum sp. DZ06]|uniref:SPOR domain-containing protein n=1 Tax=Rhodovulum sp. DZ06 TaxID=3425126 RepID=UPI003D3260DD